MPLMLPSCSGTTGAASAGRRLQAATACGGASSSCCFSYRHQHHQQRFRQSLGQSRRRRQQQRRAISAAASGGGGGGRRSKGGPSDSYSETWDGSKYDMGQMGMWDGPNIEGPSCIRLPPLELATLEELEATYVQAKNTYFSGQPVVDDVMFDEIEKRLKFLGSNIARKYPRCSRRNMRVYSDASADYEQMRALGRAWLAFFALGLVLVVVDFHDAIRATLFSDTLHFGHLEHFGRAAGEAAAGGTAADAAGGGDAAGGDAAATVRPPVLGLIGIFLAQSGWSKFASLRGGNTMALTGVCPNCAEPVFAFLPATKADVQHQTECHVCARRIVFQANIARNDRSPWRRVAAGRIYLVSRTDDYHDDDGEGAAGSGSGAAPPRRLPTPKPPPASSPST